MESKIIMINILSLIAVFSAGETFAAWVVYLRALYLYKRYTEYAKGTVVCWHVDYMYDIQLSVSYYIDGNQHRCYVGRFHTVPEEYQPGNFIEIAYKHNDPSTVIIKPDKPNLRVLILAIGSLIATVMCGIALVMYI